MVAALAATLAACGGDPSSTVESALNTPQTARTIAPTPTAASTAPDTAPTVGDGCSVDNSPTAVAAAPGPAPTIRVESASLDNALPDLAVRRINCAGGWVNLKNEIPADRPLLVWFWAPY